MRSIATFTHSGTLYVIGDYFNDLRIVQILQSRASGEIILKVRDNHDNQTTLWL